MLRLLTRSWMRRARPLLGNGRGICSNVKISDGIAAALKQGRPVVALESTILTHGMPYPHNVRTAVEVESILRREQVTPATVAVIDGTIHVGISEDEIKQLGQPGGHVVKLARRDLSHAVVKRLSGGTTVSATMHVAHLVGIQVFVTGGIGGVHRDFANAFDVSADLTELARTPVGVVCAGAKAILDLAKTLEYLETHSVPVYVFGAKNDFPQWFSPSTGLRATANVDSIDEAAHLIDVHLGQKQSGLVLAVPIPDADQLHPSEYERIIEQTMADAKEQRIVGKDLTPFLLERVTRMTAGKSLHANIALIKNNALIGAKIARRMSVMKASARAYSTQRSPEVVVVGGTNIDLMVKTEEPVVFDGRTNTGTLTQSFGGVGRNIADCLTRLGCTTAFITAIGQDDAAESLLRANVHMDWSYAIRWPNYNTASYTAFLEPSGSLLFGVGDMLIHDTITPEQVEKCRSLIEQSKLVISDGNIPANTIKYICDLCEPLGIPVWFQPTDVLKASKVFERGSAKISCISPNFNELEMISKKLQARTGCSDMKETRKNNTDSKDRVGDDRVAQAAIMSQYLLSYVPMIIVTLGEKGLLLATKNETIHFEPIPANSIVSVSGAGDCLISATAFALLRGRLPIDDALLYGLAAASLSLQTFDPVPVHLKESVIRQRMAEWSPKLRKFRLDQFGRRP